MGALNLTRLMDWNLNDGLKQMVFQFIRKGHHGRGLHLSPPHLSQKIYFANSALRNWPPGP